ncbi:MAG: hypothetical protein COU11_00890, partial [Candidatus Harrisonbacteria bacterium CG10_big_fil_rev_8_21_14_0_10_49_15]
MSSLGSHKLFARPLVVLLSLQLAFGSGFFGLVSELPRAEAATGIPTILSYQGRLTDSDGDLLGGASGTTYYFKFSIWDNSSVGSGTKLWPSGSPSSASSTVTSGVFNVNIGDTAAGYPDALDYDFQTNKDVYLQVEVSSDDATFETLSPRQRVTSAGFAINAGTLLGFTPSQSPSASNIPVLNSGNLLLAGTNPQLNATSTNTLTLQGGTGTGDILFFSSSTKITSSGDLTIGGDLTASASTTFGGVAYTWPGADGASGYVLSTDGNGTLSWALDQTGAGAASYWILGGSTLYTTSTATSVGVGTASPSSTLHVIGTLQATGSSTLTDLTFSNATATGNLQTATLNTTGAINASSTLTVTGQTTLGSASSTNFSVSGTISLPAGSIGSSELASSGVTAGSYGSSNVIATITVDEDGRLTSVSTSSISGLTTSEFATTSISQWNNDAGYVTSTTGITAINDLTNSTTSIIGTSNRITVSTSSP